MVIETMASQGKEPTFCMGDDIPLAVLSQRPHMLYDYFKQRFAQVWSNKILFLMKLFWPLPLLLQYNNWCLVLSGIMSDLFDFTGCLFLPLIFNFFATDTLHDIIFTMIFALSL